MPWKATYVNPNKCLELKPTTQSVLFCGSFISLSAVAFSSGLSVSFVSKIFSNKAQPSLPTARKLAKSLGMTIGTFLQALEDHQALAMPVVPVPAETPQIPVEKAS